MFTTHSAFRRPLQLDETFTTWRFVELLLGTPWFVATTLDSAEHLRRTFLLSSCDDVLQFSEREPFGKLIGLKLVLPPHHSPSNDWSFVPIRRIERTSSRADVATGSAVLTDVVGVKYGGFPIEPIEAQCGPLTHVADLPTAQPTDDGE